MARPGSERLIGPPTCKKCGEFDARLLKPHPRMPWGLSHICRKCKWATDQERNTYSWNVIEYLKSLGCQSCGLEDHECLEFHHMHGKEKGVSATSRMNSSYRKLCEELSKCVVLCANCHAKFHHGTLQGMPLILFSKEELVTMGEKCNGYA